MGRVHINAKIDKEPIKRIKEMAKEEKRDFGNMLNIILCDWYKDLTDRAFENILVKPAKNPLDKNEIDPVSDGFNFDQFWKAGMRKVGDKKKAKSRFVKILRNQKFGTDHDFTQFLVNDIQRRLNINQLGFDAMHPTTYLNGERWNDEIKGPNNGQAKSTFDELTDKTWAVGYVDALKQ